jgi:imidazole glycerol-phosphate synthase subunit HisF
MNNIRIIAVVTVVNNRVVQSFGYNSYLPLGSPECILENLDRWGADEIYIQVIDRSKYGKGPDYDLLDRVASLGLSTPIIYGGGINCIKDGIKVIQNGADRIILDSMLKGGNLTPVRELSSHIGSQAIIASLPLSFVDKKVVWRDYINKTEQLLIQCEFIKLIRDKTISESIIVDWKHEGGFDSFDMNLIDSFPVDEAFLIPFGGLSSPQTSRKLMTNTRLSAIAVGNSLNYKEHGIQKYKEYIDNKNIRKETYSKGQIF